jgi:CRP-like cAMP-binding protein
MSKNPPQNYLLNSLRRKDRALLVGLSETVPLTSGDTLCEPSQPIRHVYFPISGIVSQLFPVDTRENMELALVGREGMLGLPKLLGMNIAVMTAIVQGSGTALRIDAAAFSREIDRLPELRRQLHRYVYVVLAQLALTSSCARFHALDARLARSLLMTHDRANYGSFHLTHKFLGQMLGVRRVGVTKAAGRLQKRKIVSYSRGNITVLNRAGLEKASCSCYCAGENTYRQILG